MTEGGLGIFTSKAKSKLNRISGRSYEGLETLDYGFRELSRAKREALIELG